MANGITLKVDSGPYIVTTAPANFYTDAGLSSAVTAPVTITADTVWYCSAAVATAVPNVTIVAKQLDGSTIFNGTIRVGQTTDTYLRPTPTAGQLSQDVSGSLVSQMYSAGRESFPRWAATGSIGMTSQVLRLTYMTAPVSETINSIAMCTNTTAAGATPTVVRFGLYTVASDGALTLVASTTNDTALFAAASTLYTKDLSTPYAVTAGLRYCVGSLVVTGATAPTVSGATLSNGMIAVSPRLTGGVSSQADLPASVSAATINGGTAAAMPWAALIAA